MPKIMADHNVEGQLQVLLRVWLSRDWNELWTATGCEIESFERLSIRHDESDTAIWQLCQEREILLITGNRNAEGEDSLEATIRRYGTDDSLPVFTISDPDRVMRDRDYAERIAARIIEYLQRLDAALGAGRLYLP